MANFLIVVHLPTGDPQDYERIAELLAKSGYSKTVRALGGEECVLPPGHYSKANDSRDVEVVRDEVVDLTQTVPGHPQVLISQGPSAWLLPTA